MPLPRWDDPALRAGTMVRTALWLMTEVGVGNSFTKEQHRRAFAGVTQADRRLRDLRTYGWVIHTSAEDVTLRPEEQRFVSPGAAVWDARQRRAAPIAVPAADRMAILAESDYQCIVCGIAGGERYADAPHMTAVLSVTRREVVLRPGDTRTMHVSECKRCCGGEPGGQSIDISNLIDDINRLHDADRAILERWMTEGRRTAVDRVWAVVRRLPAEAREQLRKIL